MSFSRRQFLQSAAVTSAAVQAALAAEVDSKSGMPMRVLGKTGQRVSILAFGSGSRWLSYPSEDQALEAMTSALKSGVNYIDTAYSYGNGESETRVGKLMPEWRSKIFLATKIPDRDGDAAMRRIEGSLKRLNTDKIDLLHIHSLTSKEDLAAIEAPTGILNVLRKMRDQKVARFIGITCHTDPAVLKTALERNDFDCTQMALNAARAGQAKGISALGEYHPHSFETLALPVALNKKMGVLAMKIFAQEGLNGKAPVDQLIRYTLSLPVAAAVIGMPKPEHIQQNLAVVKSFQPMPAEQMRKLSTDLSTAHKASLDNFFYDHVDA
jgi:predicted aldo/keto reductase-like oxidoreductase